MKPEQTIYVRCLGEISRSETETEQPRAKLPRERLDAALAHTKEIAEARCEAIDKFAHSLIGKTDRLTGYGILAEAEKARDKIRRRAHKHANWLRRHLTD